MKSIVALIALILLGVGVFLLLSHMANSPLTPASEVCTMEAKICPDGSAVGRTGPHCEFAACPDAAEPVATSSDITLDVGKSGEVQGLKVTFNSFVQDSRCPIDVQCIQAGAVTINVTFAHGPHIETKNMPSDEVPQIFDEYKISIVHVAPARESKTEIQKDAYRVTFHVST
jgi:hypothetical protein